MKCTTFEQLETALQGWIGSSIQEEFPKLKLKDLKKFFKIGGSVSCPQGYSSADPIFTDPDGSEWQWDY